MYGAHLLHMSARWIVVGGVLLVGVGMLSGVNATPERSFGIAYDQSGVVTTFSSFRFPELSQPI